MNTEMYYIKRLTLLIILISVVHLLQGCTSAVTYHADPVEVGRLGGYDGPAAGATDFRQVNGEWQCVYHIYAHDPEPACVLNHERTWHCEPGLAHAKGYGDVATYGSIRLAAGSPFFTHPSHDDNGNKYRDCGKD